jgi:arsenate reductase
MTVSIYHNPRCSKSRQTLAILEERGIEVEVIEYLQTPPDADTLLSLANELGISLHELMRTGEEEYKIARAEVDAMDAAKLAQWLTHNPKVIQRPIVVTDKGVRIGRPPESVIEILE